MKINDMTHEEVLQAMKKLWAEMQVAKNNKWEEYTLHRYEINLVIQALEIAGEM